MTIDQGEEDAAPDTPGWFTFDAGPRLPTHWMPLPEPPEEKK